MKESTLWGHLRAPLGHLGKFQKLSDRFSLGVPDVLGCVKGRGIAIELKELDGTKIWKTKFRPGQLKWLEDWDLEDGAAWIMSSHGQVVMIHPGHMGQILEVGSTPEFILGRALLTFQKNRSNRWESLVEQISVLLEKK